MAQSQRRTLARRHGRGPRSPADSIRPATTPSKFAPPATPWTSTTIATWPCRFAKRSASCASTAGRPAVRSSGAADYLAVALGAAWRTIDTPSPLQADVATESALLERNSEHATIASSSATSPNSPPAKPTPSTPISAAAAASSSFSAIKSWPIATTRELGVAGEGRAGGPHILPARLGAVVDRPQFRLDPLDYRHPILHTFRGRGQTSLLTTPVFKHFRLTPPEELAGDHRPRARQRRPA